MHRPAGCELISELLTVLGVVNVSLHSGKNQARRMASLGKFKSGAVKVWIDGATKAVHTVY